MVVGEKDYVLKVAVVVVEIEMEVEEFWRSVIKPLSRGCSEPFST